MKKDLIRPLQRKDLYPKLKRTILPTWAINTIKKCPTKEMLPKFQQYKNYYFYNVSQDQKNNYRRSFLPTDNIGVRYPEKNKMLNSEQSKFSFLEMKSKFNPQSCTVDSWSPSTNQTTMANRSSVSYNIINNENDPFYIKPSVAQSRINFKKIGVGHYGDLKSPFAINFNKKYNEAYGDNPGIFKAYKGIFTKMYDDAARNGNIYLPFETKQSRSLNAKNNVS